MSSFDINMSESSYPQGHTFRHRYNRYTNYKRGMLECSRPPMNNELIPITEVDSLLSVRDIYTLLKPKYFFRGISFTLNKRELFNDFIEACEEFATEKKVTYDVKTGLDKYEYEVPVVDFLNPYKIPHGKDIYEPIPCPKKEYVKPKQQQSKKNKKRSWKYYEMKKQAKVESHYVVIDGNRYNSDFIYKRSANGFVPIIMHPNQKVEYDDDEGIMRSKTTTSKTSITITFPKDSTVNGIVLNPEPMKFEHVYDTRARGVHRNHLHIRVLENDPGYIQKFELYFRSSNTDGQWIKYGIFDGNTSIFDSTKIKFDEIVAKEIRLVPITHTGSFEKVTVTTLTHIEKRYDEAEDDTVIYTIYFPHGKFRHDYSYEMDNIGSGRRHVCDCYRCVGTKGQKKTSHREFMEQVHDS